MQKMLCLLFCCLLFPISHLAQSNALPDQPWRSIWENSKRNPNQKWEYDVEIKLRGNYSEADSLMVVRAIEELNVLTPSIELSMSPNEIGNLEIFFLDSAIYEDYSSYLIPPDSLGISFIYTDFFFNSIKTKRKFDLSFDLSLVPDTSRQHFVLNNIAWALYPCYLNMNDAKEWLNLSDPSIFSFLGEERSKASYAPLQELDKVVLRAVYSVNYEENLVISEEQFKRFYLPKWLDKYSHGLLIWPLVIVLFLFSGLFVWLYRRYFVRINHSFLRFNLAASFGLLVFGFFLSMFFALGFRLDEGNDSGFRWGAIFGGVLMTLVVGLLTVNVLRLVEIYVSRKSTHKFIRSFILFLSISLLPAGTLFGVVFSFPGEQWKDEVSIIIMLVVLLVFSVVGVIRALISFFVLKEKEIRVENELQVSLLRQLKTQAELNALHSKINPHFLYNALNSIAGLAHVSAEKTEHMALALSKLFRYSINREQSDWSTLGEEINMVKIYLDIEKVRFDDRLDFSVDLPEELFDERVPRFMIQPLVENAIKHGISKLTGQGIINVEIQKNARQIEVAVADNGPGFPDDLVPGFGLQGIYDKLEIMYPGQFELHFVNAPQKQAIVKLKIS